MMTTTKINVIDSAISYVIVAGVLMVGLLLYLNHIRNMPRAVSLAESELVERDSTRK